MKKNKEDESSRFMGLLVQNQRAIQAFIAYMVPNRSDNDDILQDTLSEMWKKFDEYQEGTNFKAWGIAIAKFKIILHQRKYKNSKLHFSSETMEILQEEAKIESGKDTINHQKDMLRKCLKKLSERELEFLSYRYKHQLTFQGVAEKFGISMQGAFKAVSVIHARLLKCINLNMHEEGLI